MKHSIFSSINKEHIKHSADALHKCIRYAVKWMILGTVTGVIGGGIGALFWHALHFAAEAREAYPVLLWFLPIGGAFIAWLYRVTKLNKLHGTDLLIESVNEGTRIPFTLVGGIVFTTFVTHLVGGSAGKEGAALQLGGALGHKLGRIFRLKESDLHYITLCGMAGLFAALFGTPVTAAVFVVEFVSVGTVMYAGFLAAVISSFVALWAAMLLGCEYSSFVLADVPEISIAAFSRVLLLALVIAAAAVLFVLLLRTLEHLAAKIRIPELRGAIGGAMLLGGTLLVGSQMYNGPGMDTIEHIIKGGEVPPYAFLLKMIFTAVTLAAGFKGGEIVPSFFIGAALGAAVSPLIGLDPVFGAALGLVGFFCAVSNSTFASLVLAVELFGGDGIVYFAVLCAASFALSGNYGLYVSQRFAFKKYE